MKYTTILIDDEPLAISRLKRLLSKFNDVFEVIDSASNGQEGLEKIELQKPDLIFLDIEMPLMSGFEMLNALSHMPMVIFCTAFDQYAIKAFEENSIDYLLKPVEKSRLEKTVEKLKSLGTKDEAALSPAMLSTLLAQVNHKKPMHSITVKKGEKILFIPLHDVSYFQAEGKYVFLNTIDGIQYLITHTITSLNEKLPDNFVQISRSAIIRVPQIKSLEKTFNGKFMIYLKDRKNTQLESGSSYGGNIRSLMEV